MAAREPHILNVSKKTRLECSSVLNERDERDPAMHGRTDLISSPH
jgi:hypothetical protein